MVNGSDAGTAPAGTSMLERLILQTEGQRGRHQLEADQQQRALQEELVGAYQGGLSLRAVAAAHGVSVLQVRRSLASVDARLRRRGSQGQPTDELRLLLELDQAGTPQAEIASRLGVSSERVRQILRAAGRPSRLRRRRSTVARAA